VDINSIQKQLQLFADERDWDQFHNPKNLVMALSVETSELVEIFQWLTLSESSNLKNDPIKLNQVSDEIADVALYLIRLADKLGVNIESAINLKLIKNANKYPAEKVRGSSKKYNEYRD
jgi:dCTP diphosphatase